MRVRTLLGALAAAMLFLPAAGGASDKLNLRLDFGGYGPRHEAFSAKRMIRGASVVDSAGHEVGAVRDLLVRGDGGIESLVIRGGGFLGIGRTEFGYPWAKAMIARPDLVKLPFDTGRIASYKDRFGDMREDGVPPGLHRLGDFMGRHLYVEAGEVRFGSIEDAMIDTGGRVLGLVIDPMPQVASSSALHAIPFRIDPAAGYRLEGDRYIVPDGATALVRLDRFRSLLKEKAAAD